MIVLEPVQAAIWHCLNNYAHKDAVFLAERLCCEVESDETIFILATSYYRSNLVHQAFWLLKEKSRRSPQCRFLQAKCAFQLKKYAEAESALNSNGFGDLKSFDEIIKDFGDIASFALELIAHICLKTERTKIAAGALRKALKLNPFLWQAFADLCQLDKTIDPPAIFQIPNTDVFTTCLGQSSNVNPMILFGGGGGGGACSTIPTTNSLNDSTAAPTVNTTNQNNIGELVSSAATLTNTTNFILSTPVDQTIQQQQQQQQHQALHQNNNAMTPNNNINNSSNNNNLNNSISMLRGGNLTIGGGASQQQQQQQHHHHQQQQRDRGDHNNSSMLMMLEDTPVLTQRAGNVSISSSAKHHQQQQQQQNSSMMLLDDTPRGGGGGGGGGGVGVLSTCDQTTFDGGAGTPFRKHFKYFTSIIPTTPSFGVLPLSSPCDGDTSFICNNYASAATQLQLSASLNSTNSPQPSQTLAEVNQEQKVIGKRIKSHVASLQIRKDSTANTTATHKPNVFTQTGNITPRTPNNNTSNTGGVLPNAAVRRSSRLFSNAYSVKENNKSPNLTSNKFVQPRSPPRKTKSRMAKICLNNELIEDKTSLSADKLEQHKQNRNKDKEKIETVTSATTGKLGIEDTKVMLNNSLNNAQTMAHHLLALKKQSADGLMSLLRDLGEAYKQFSQYQCKAAIKHIEATIPKHHLCSSWVQSLIGMALYELREHESAVAVFKRIHENEPHRMDCMEIYSSSLWQLQREVELAALAQDLVNQDKTSPITWCVAGNCFSLHKEHDTAIKYFKRAVQVDPDFVYSYTLLGHELVLTEELDKAMDSFRSAALRDDRHYNAWFGIGTIYSKQEKYELAELHYLKALKINPLNSVLLVHIGVMQFFMHKKEQALQTLNTAAALDPQNPLARFHRGSIYFSLGKYQEALRELEELKEIVPKESVVFYLIGKIHKTLGNVDLALMHFSWATDLDPKGANNQLKDAFDSMSYTSYCPAVGDYTLDAEFEPISERSDDSTQANQDVINYDSDY